MTDEPIVNVRQGIDAKGVATLVVEVKVETRQPGMLLLAIDLSDSSPVTEAEIARLPRLLAPLPRTWPVTITGLGTAAATVAARLNVPTVGDVVEGVIDLRTILLEASVIRRERTAGSFLGQVLDQFLAAADRVDSRLVAIVLTDGRLVDADPVSVPESMRVLGLAPDQGSADSSRWSEIVPGAPLISRDTEQDAIGKLRAAAGCAFYGPCVVVIPNGEYRVRAANDAAPGDFPPNTERRRPWDFSLKGRLVLEFVGSALPDHLIVEGADGVEFRLPLPKPSEAALAEAAQAQSSESGASLELVNLSLHGDETVSLLRRARELVESRSAWQAPDGTLAIAHQGSVIAAHIVDEAGRPRADFYVLIAHEETGDSVSTDSHPLLLIRLRRDSRIDFSPGTMSQDLTPFSVGTSWSMHFDNLENRWMFASAGAPPAPLPPRGSHSLPADMRNHLGERCVVFFSGFLRTP